MKNLMKDEDLVLDYFDIERRARVERAMALRDWVQRLRGRK